MEEKISKRLGTAIYRKTLKDAIDDAHDKDAKPKGVEKKKKDLAAKCK